MILLLGSHGYMGMAFVRELKARGLNFQTESHNAINAVDCFIRMSKVDLVINCAAYIPKPSVAACDQHKIETLRGNVLLPGLVSDICKSRDVPFMHLSTACLFDEQKEYTEDDVPTRGFGGHCGYYVGTKLMAEELVREHPQHYILRLRLPFDEFDCPRNYLSKLAGFKTVYDHVNSLTHRGDFVKAALDLWENEAPWGTYHVVNPGFVTAKKTFWAIHYSKTNAESWTPVPNPSFISNDTTGCTLSTAKLLSTGVRIRPVNEALEDALNNWKPAL